MKLPCTLGEAKGALDYMISWPLSSPVNAFKFGRQHSTVAGVVAGAIGVPAILVMFIVGPIVATWNWLTAE